MINAVIVKKILVQDEFALNCISFLNTQEILQSFFFNLQIFQNVLFLVPYFMNMKIVIRLFVRFGAPLRNFFTVSHLDFLFSVRLFLCLTSTNSDTTCSFY